MVVQAFIPEAAIETFDMGSPTGVLSGLPATHPAYSPRINYPLRFPPSVLVDTLLIAT
jgi:hypothetical protein